MKFFVAAPRSLAGFFFAQSIRIPINRCIRPFIAVLILTLAGNAYAAITVGLSIENDIDSNGNITVIEGDKIKVAYTVIEDTNNDLHKNDKIQLLRVSDATIVATATRGKKKTGTVSLKVKNSVDEQLYVRYVRKGAAGTEVARTSHPDDGDDPIMTIAKANLTDLTIGQNALKFSGQPLMAYSVLVQNHQHYRNVGTTPVQSNRTVSYNKRYDDSLLKVTWNDNLRSYNYTNTSASAECSFHLYFDGEPCTNPGALHAALYTAVSNVTNPHQQRSLIGVCRATASGPILAGTHEIRVYVAEVTNADIGCYMGFHSTSTLLVEELP